MKLANQNLNLPKITHRNIQQLLSHNKKSPIVDKNLLRLSYIKNGRQCQYHSGSNRNTDMSMKCYKPDFVNPFAQSCFEIKSPFYQKLNFNNPDKCSCRFHRLKRNANKSQNNYHHNSFIDNLIMKKLEQLKKHQQRRVNHIRQDHQYIHKKMQQNQKNYVQSSLQKSSKLKQTRLLCNIKNKTVANEKIQKTLNQKMVNKQFKKVFFKQKLQKVYQLNNQNQPFDKILQKRNIWQKQKRRWGTRIINHINKKIKICKLRQQQLSLQKQNVKQANKCIKQQKLIQEQLLAIEKCLPIVLNNLASIQQLLGQQTKSNIKDKIKQIFMKNLKLETSEQGKKLFNRLVKTVRQIKEEEQKRRNDASNQKSANNQTGRNNQINLAHAKNQQNITFELLNQQLENSQILNSQQKSNNNLKQSYLNNSSVSVQRSNFQKSNNKKNSLTSVKSDISKKLSKLSKISFMSRALSISSTLSKRKDEFDDQKSKEDKQKTSDFLSVNSPKQSKNASRAMIQCESLGESLSNYKKSKNCSFNATPSLSKHVISQKQEDIYEQDQDDNYDNKNNQNANRKSAIQILDQMERLQTQRVNFQIQFIKSKIRLRNAFIQISIKYKHIKYEKFCSKPTFGYISSLVDQFNGLIKHQFLYSQLQLKKNVLEDDYIQQLIKQFASMFVDQNQLNQWKAFLFQQRNKVILEKLNRMIDLGIKQIKYDKPQEPVIKIHDQYYQSIRNDQPIVFRKFDQSQAAYERYLQKLERKNCQTKLGVTYIENNLNNINKGLNVKEENDQQITQKTIEEKIHQAKHQEILYSVRNNQIGQQQSFLQVSPSRRTQKDDKFNKQGKKKILKYLLKKKPQQFQMLNKQIQDFSHLINQTFSK